VNDAARGSELSRLLDAALELPPAERLAWVETLDATHEPLKPRLRALLARAADVESRDFLGSLPALDTDTGTDATLSPPSGNAGARVGPYRLERPLGAGGMGTVWLASRADGMFDRQVALKLPHRGMFGADLAERMTRERSILAGLEHPHIARLYDAGLADDGQPYLALEYVEGQPIDAWCREHHSDLRTRLQLLVQVADAVAAAHARLVVHRDLKPANILVTGEGYVRLLDFGIAKLLDAPAERSGLTQLSVHALTPDYASPEQVLGEPVTTGSDVYSLGVVLYELLTGERPYRLRRDTRGALEDAILQAEPRRPSEVPGPFARALRGDIDTIVLKALRKKPAERYATVNAFADDLRNHLAGRPVLARPDSAWYRTSRFLRRNRLVVGAAAVVTVALIAGAVSTTVGLIRARAAEQRALAEAQTSREVARFMVDLFKVSDPSEARGNSITAREILDRASQRVTHELQAAPGVRAELLFTMANVYSKLGLYVNALDLAKASLELRGTEGDALKRAASLDQVGEILTLMRRGKEAAPLHEEVLAIRRGMNPIDHQAVARTLLQLALSHYMQGEFDPTITLLGEARTELDQAQNPDAVLRSDILKYTANLFHEKGDFAHAIPAYREALAQYRAALGENHPSVASALGDLAIALKDTQQFDEAEKAYLDSLAIQRLILSPAHPDVGNALNNLAVLYAERGQHDKALASAQEGAGILRAALGEDHDMTNIARLNAARANVQLGNFAVAEREFRAILAIRRRTLNPENLSLPLTIDALADVLNREKKYADAETYAREARAGMEAAVGREHWRWANVSRTLGVSLTGQGKFAEAEPILLASYEVSVRKRGPTHRTTQLTAQRVADLYQAWGRQQPAQEWLAKSQPALQ